MFDKELFGPDAAFIPKTLREVVYTPLPHRNEDCEVIYGHEGDQFLIIRLKALRIIASSIRKKLEKLGFKKGDTILLASFSSSNELSNALIFTAAVCMGIRVFVPIFPEASELPRWKTSAEFTGVVMPFRETLEQKGYEREKEVIRKLQQKCTEMNIPFLDARDDLSLPEIIRQALTGVQASVETKPAFPEISPQTEAVIFTTSGSSGISKLVVYTHERLANCCQAWQQCDLFRKEMFGNPGFSPLFTHTIGIRTYLHSIWSGNPFCMVVTDWFLHKPETVRYLLMKMKPGHIIAGPAFFNNLLELFRQYPELKSAVHHSLKAAISIGAPFNEKTANQFRSATGISMMNGFGTTETLMISLNIPDPGETTAKDSLGMLLPGVRIGLKQSGTPPFYEMYIHSDFQSSRTIGEEQSQDYFRTGDLVRFDDSTREIFYHSRESDDFIKDEYGVKIPVGTLRKYYDKLYESASRIEWIPLVNIPGLAALIFLKAKSRVNQKVIASLIKNLNEEMKRTIEPFEYSHRHIERFTVLTDEVPLTRKGTVSKDLLASKYSRIMEELRNPFVYNPDIEITETGDKSYLYKFSNPHLAGLLEAMKMDKTYLKGEGDYLYYKERENLLRVTDFVGGFGANLMGHDHPRIREAIIVFLQSGYPVLNNQGSLYHYPALLAKELNKVFSTETGKYFKVHFGNSGTEATEIAIHHAYFEWRKKFEKIRDEQLQLFGGQPDHPVPEVWENNMRMIEMAIPRIIVVNHCFHGYTSGARSLLNSRKQRSYFSGLLRPQPLMVSDRSNTWKETLLRFIGENLIELQLFKMVDGDCVAEPVKFSAIIASFIEPVRGEGGISETDTDLADFLSAQEFPLISDEIQCGMGRTGSIPSYPKASYYLLGKSLGGGFEKISAVLIDDNRFEPDFSQYFNSTFANGEMAAYMALTTLKIIEEENLPAQAGQKGSQFLTMLQQVAREYPDIIKSVEGKGLMLGIHFNPEMGTDNVFLRILFENEKAGFLFSGWLLNQRQIRVLPSLSKPNSLRLEPSFYLPENEMKRLCDSLRELCNLCREKKIYELCRFIMNGDPWQDRSSPVFRGTFPQKSELPEIHGIKIGFIGNFTQPHRELQVLEPGFREASDTGLRILFNRLQILMEGKPLRIMSKNLMNGKIHFTFYILPFDTSQMEVVSRWGKRRFFISKIQEAVNRLAEEGVKCLSLGAHTSIITGNGLNIAEPGRCKVLTGNTLTVASCLYYLNQYLGQTGADDREPKTIAIVGAGGNIGTGLTECLNDRKYSKYPIILTGGNEKRLGRLKDNLTCNRKVKCSENLFDMKMADIIICCANTNDPILFPHHISRDKPVFIIDISVPGAISEEVKQMDNVEFCHDASSVFLTGDRDLLFSSHTPEGKIFCCAGETILYALHDLHLPMKGHVRKDSVLALLPIAVDENFFKTFHP